MNFQDPALSKFLTSIYNFLPPDSATFHICHFTVLWTDFLFSKSEYKCWKLGLHFIYALEWYMTFIAPIFMELPMAQRQYVEICICRFRTKSFKKY